MNGFLKKSSYQIRMAIDDSIVHRNLKTRLTLDTIENKREKKKQEKKNAEK